MKLLHIISFFFFQLLAFENVHCAENPSAFSKIKPLVFQVKTSRDANSSKASYGTGFVVDSSGLLITNYHVISSVVQDRYNLYKIFVVDKDQNYQAEIINFSVVHDLALIKINKKFDNILSIIIHIDNIYIAIKPSEK